LRVFSFFSHKIFVFLFVALVAFVSTLGLYYSVDDKKKSADVSMNSSPPRNSESNSIRFMPIGDSYTIALGVSNPADRWPNLLVETLSKEGVTLELIANPSVSGYDVSDAILRELPLFEKEKPDLGTLFIGTNDAFRQNDLSQFEKDYVVLVDRMQNALTDKNNLVLITIPNYARFPQAVSFGADEREEQLIEGYNQVIRNEAKKRNLPLVDLYTINSMNGSEFFISDGIHPNPKGIKVWHDAILPVVRNVIKN
jgi:lysophospholipase L1-like esterase